VFSDLQNTLFKAENIGKLLSVYIPQASPANQYFFYFTGYQSNWLQELDESTALIDSQTIQYNNVIDGPLSNDDPITFRSGDSSFSFGLKPNTIYYVVNVANLPGPNDGSFQVAETPGGDPLELYNYFQQNNFNGGVPYVDCSVERVLLNKVLLEVVSNVTNSAFVTTDITSAIKTYTAIPNNLITYNWSLSQWGGENGWPKISSAISSRFVLANSISDPTAIWFSLFDNIYFWKILRTDISYTTNEVGREGVPRYDGESQANDPYRYILTDELSREVRWLYPSRNLEFGTDVGEFTLENFSSSPNLAGGTSAVAKFESSYGGIFQNPLKVGNATIFILKDGKSLGRILFDFQRDANSVLNINVLAPNILNDFRDNFDNYDAPVIRKIEWDHVRRVLWVISSTGDVFTVSTSFNVDTFGWQSHSFNDLVFEVNGDDVSLIQNTRVCNDILITKNTVGRYSQDTPLFIFENTIEHMVPRNEYPTEALDNSVIYTERDNLFNFHYLDGAETLNDWDQNTLLWTFTNPLYAPYVDGTDIKAVKEVHVFVDNIYLGVKSLSPYAMAVIDNVIFVARNASTNGNTISLTFNGTTDTVGDIVDAWNGANVGNEVDAVYRVGNRDQIPLAQTAELGGAGYNLLFDNIINNITGNKFSTVTAGFPFRRRLKKTLLHSGSNTESGLEAYKRVDQIEIKFYRSIYAKTGSEEGNLRDIDFPLQNDIINLQNYNYVDAFSGNSEPEHTVIVESELPLPVNILTITTRGVLAD